MLQLGTKDIKTHNSKHCEECRRQISSVLRVLKATSLSWKWNGFVVAGSFVHDFVVSKYRMYTCSLHCMSFRYLLSAFVALFWFVWFDVFRPQIGTKHIKTYDPKHCEEYGRQITIVSRVLKATSLSWKLNGFVVAGGFVHGLVSL